MNNLFLENIDLSGIEVVILDLDGTLYNKQNLVRRIIVHELLFLPLLKAERETRKKMRDKCFPSEEGFYDAFFQTMSVGHLFISQIARKWYFKNYMPLMIRLLKRYYHSVEWLPSLTKQCNRQNISMVVFSDYGCVSEKLAALGINKEQFSMVISAPELGGLKPCIGVVKRLMEKMLVSPEHCLFIGDRQDTDGECAAVVGAKYLRV